MAFAAARELVKFLFAKTQSSNTHHAALPTVTVSKPLHSELCADGEGTKRKGEGMLETKNSRQPYVTGTFTSRGKGFRALSHLQLQTTQAAVDGMDQRS